MASCNFKESEWLKIQVNKRYAKFNVGCKLLITIFSNNLFISSYSFFFSKQQARMIYSNFDRNTFIFIPILFEILDLDW